MTDTTVGPEEAVDARDAVPPAEVPEMELFHAHSFLTHYVFSQDAKIIAI